MKKHRHLLILALSLFTFSLPTQAFRVLTEKVTLEDVVTKVSTQNFEVLENALKVYQAKEAIQVARGNLLPKLNIWKYATLPFDPKAALGLIEDIAPFLVPSNWWRLSEQKLLFVAEKEAYRALWANEVMTAKALYIHYQMDSTLLGFINKQTEKLKGFHTIIRSREILGALPAGSSKEIEVRLLGLQEDKRALEVLLNEERSTLSYLMGFEESIKLEFVQVTLPEFTNLEPLEFDDFEFRVVDSSPEIREYDQLVKVAKYLKKEAAFSFLGASSTNRGVAGGIFDDLPISSGLGFGTSASMRIAEATREILKIQKKGVEETLRRRLRLIIDNYNLDLENYDNLKLRKQLTQEVLDQLYSRLKVGENIDMLSLVEASRNQIQADAQFLSLHYRFLVNEDRLARLVFHGDYKKPPAVVDLIKKGLENDIL